ncbi:hypothetical protein G4B88_015929 [Cannabis sativa]|uniref:Myb/SANT-like domain-containing protein n=1 Tax=Cannabis sativa TaxID=3483 RepID=A0A7J6EJK2_CANSA|nr:hypothetical protein G4B88_015929 [Cannabis sativa]
MMKGVLLKWVYGVYIVPDICETLNNDVVRIKFSEWDSTREVVRTEMTRTDSEVVIIDNSEASVWPEKHEEIFIELMEEEVLKGNRNTTTFTKQSWKRINEELYAQAKRKFCCENGIRIRENGIPWDCL